VFAFTIPTLFCPEKFKLAIIDYYKKHVCHLCGEFHSVRFYESRPRVFRYIYGKENEWDIVYRIECTSAQKAGKQRTLTILPHFLLPGCLVRADDVLTMGKDPSLNSDIDAATIFLQVGDTRTTQKHLDRFGVCLREFNQDLSGIVVGLGGYLPAHYPDKVDCLGNQLRWHSNLLEELVRLNQGLYGSYGLSPKILVFYFQFFVHEVYPCANNIQRTPKKTAISESRPPPDRD